MFATDAGWSEPVRRLYRPVGLSIQNVVINVVFSLLPKGSKANPSLIDKSEAVR